MLSKRKFLRNCVPCTFKYCTEPIKPTSKRIHPLIIGQKLTVARKMKAYFESAPHLMQVRATMPRKYLKQRSYGKPENLYLVDSEVANDAANRIFPTLKKSERRLICETNPGWGLVSARLLKLGISRIRLYECCSELRNTLKSLNDNYPGRIELFIKDLFHLGRYSMMDRMDKGDRVEQFLRDVPKHEWTDEPALSVIGTMATFTFMNYLFKTLALQSEIMARGRIELFVFLKCEDFLKLGAGPHLCNMNIYRSISIFINNFFDYKLLAEYPRKSFLPWEAPRKHIYHVSCNYDKMYLVRLRMKEDLSLTPEQLLPYYFFVRNFYLKPRQKIVPTLEKWIPGVGAHILAPRGDCRKILRGISIYTIFGELTPSEVLALFKIVYNHPSYESSPFKPMCDSLLLKNESIDPDLADIAPSHTTEGLEEKNLLPSDNT